MCVCVWMSFYEWNVKYTLTKQKLVFEVLSIFIERIFTEEILIIY